LTRDEIELEREGTYARMVSAYARGDYGAIEAVVSDDVVFDLAGASRLAGRRRGLQGFLDFLHQTALIVRSTAEITFAHDRSDMTARRRVSLVARGQFAEVTVATTFTFDPDGNVAAISVAVEEQSEFDRVVDAFLDARA
jgi:predicted lipid-binding transport protein (Tim44 family)